MLTDQSPAVEETSRETIVPLDGRRIVTTTAVAKVAGAVGIFVGLSAVYAAIAQVWNELFGRVVLPLGSPSS